MGPTHGIDDLGGINDMTAAVAQSHDPDGRPRARGIGIPLRGRPGPLNAITDVAGVEVGYTTLIEGSGPLRVGAGPVRTGVTAILPRGRSGVGVPCAAGWYALNGNGEMTGTTWVEEVGAVAMPIAITNTHSVGAVHEGVIGWTARHHPRLGAQWMLPVVAETWDGYLNDINGFHVRPQHAVAALDAAAGGPLRNGSVGGGTGMNCYGFKAGTGTSSRLVRHGSRTFTVAVLLQANFGARRELNVAGHRLGDALATDDPIADGDWFRRDTAAGPAAGAGSVIAIVATDAPLLPGQCKALARRVPMGLARTGTHGGHFSGDIFLAFSTANPGALVSEFPLHEATDADYDAMTFLPWGYVEPLFEAVAECVEEAVLNALVVNDEMVGRDGHRSPAFPRDAAVGLMLRR